MSFIQEYGILGLWHKVYIACFCSLSFGALVNLSLVAFIFLEDVTINLHIFLLEKQIKILNKFQLYDTVLSTIVTILSKNIKSHLCGL